MTGIGLYNVNSRLKLLYGESYGLIYNEKVRNGFEIWVRLPKKLQNQKKGDKIGQKDSNYYPDEGKNIL